MANQIQNSRVSSHVYSVSKKKTVFCLLASREIGTLKRNFGRTVRNCIELYENIQKCSKNIDYNNQRRIDGLETYPVDVDSQESEKISKVIDPISQVGEGFLQWKKFGVIGWDVKVDENKKFVSHKRRVYDLLNLEKDKEILLLKQIWLDSLHHYNIFSEINAVLEKRKHSKREFNCKITNFYDSSKKSLEITLDNEFGLYKIFFRDFFDTKFKKCIQQAISKEEWNGKVGSKPLTSCTSLSEGKYYEYLFAEKEKSESILESLTSYALACEDKEKSVVNAIKNEKMALFQMKEEISQNMKKKILHAFVAVVAFFIIQFLGRSVTRTNE